MKKAIAILLAVCFVLSLTAAAASASPIKHSRGPSFAFNTYNKNIQTTDLFSIQGNYADSNVVNIGSTAFAGKGLAAASTTVLVTEQSNKLNQEVNQIII